MTYSLHLSAEQLEIRDTVRDFVTRQIKPFATRSERLEALDRSLPLPLLAHLLFDQAMTAEQRERFLPAFLADDRYHLALADTEPGTDPSLGINYHRPAAPERPVKTTATRQGESLGVRMFSTGR